MDGRVITVINLLEEDLRRGLSLDDLARSVNLSSWHLCHLFKSTTGTSPRRYVKSLRMREAQRLLEYSFLRVKEIMNLVGAHNEAQFFRDFKKTYGLSPNKYRERQFGLYLPEYSQELIVDSKIC
jgi:two-component system response regulator YesN